VNGQSAVVQNAVVSVDPADQLRRGYARLTALRDALEPVRLTQLESRYVDEFHGALEALRRTGIDVDDFKIGPNSIIQVPESTSYMGGTSGRVRSYVDKAMLMAKLKAVISYFELGQEEPPRSIGFRPH
jgi:hypothetical protein